MHFSYVLGIAKKCKSSLWSVRIPSFIYLLILGMYVCMYVGMYSFIHSFISWVGQAAVQSFSKHLLSIYHVLSSVLGPENTKMNETKDLLSDLQPNEGDR